MHSTQELSALARLFSARVFRDMATKGKSSLFRRLIEQTNLVARVGPNATVGDTFDSAFDLLNVAGHRNEYVYRVAISEKVLMGTHSLRTASMLTEFRVGNCKADLVILNGTATVYEIKSERDSLTRLLKQVDSYKRVFAKVNVVVSEDHIEDVLKTIPIDVGVMCLSKRYRITQVRDAADCSDRISPVAVFESLRRAEAVAILRAMNVPVPQVPNTQKHAAMRDLFANLDSLELHREMVKTLKRMRNLAPLGDFVDQLPRSLQTAALSISVRRSDQPRLIGAVSTPLCVAMTWS